MQEFLFGLDTFGGMTVDESGNPSSAAQVIRDLVAQGVLADQLGIDTFNIGEHHRADFAVSAPDTILAALATVTSKIRLGTGVTVLSSEDPVRVYQRFATIQALSNGRAEITAGRGSFIESFSLFGYELEDYAELFEEKLELLVELLKGKPVTWSGRLRSSLSNQTVYPSAETPIGLRVGVGGSPDSVIRAARLGIPLALAIIGGDPARFSPFAKLYRDSLAKLGRPELPVSIHSPGFITDTDEEAIELGWPAYLGSFGKIGRERGWAAPTKDSFINEVRFGSMYFGSPQTVADKIFHALTSVGANRFDLKYDNGPITHQMHMKTIELYANEVIPRVRKMMTNPSNLILSSV
jgi:probable LLM family oxidoreductase